MNLVDRLLAHPSEHPALVAGARSLTYGQLGAEAARWRGGLAAAGVGRGDRVAVLAGNDEVTVLTELAVLGAGAVLVPLNPQSPPAELARELAAVEPVGVVVGPAGEAAWAALVADGLQPAPPRLDPAGGGEPGPASDPRPAPVVHLDPDAPAALLFTSGTAGMPKPAILTHGNLDASLRALLALPLDLVGVPHVVAAVIPLFHVFGLNAVVNLGLAIGATVVVEEYRDPARLVELVAAHGVTILSGPPTLWRALTADPGLDPSALAPVTLAVSGAAKLPPDLHRAVRHRFGLEVAEGYGLTETCAVVATGAGRSAPVGSVGRLIPGVEARLVGDDGADVLVGDPGELWVRGPMVSPGYHRPGGAAPEDRRDAAGWLHTGDVALVDDDGNLAIVDRVKDLVIVSGFNVFPGEVEAVLVAHPDVAAAAVTGEPHPATGEAVVAHVVAEPGHRIDPEALVAHCRAELARYKVPHRVEVLAALPLGLGGKVRRHELG